LDNKENSILADERLLENMVKDCVNKTDINYSIEKQTIDVNAINNNDMNNDINLNIDNYYILTLSFKLQKEKLIKKIFNFRNEVSYTHQITSINSSNPIKSNTITKLKTLLGQHNFKFITNNIINDRNQIKNSSSKQYKANSNSTKPNRNLLLKPDNNNTNNTTNFTTLSFSSLITNNETKKPKFLDPDPPNPNLNPKEEKETTLEKYFSVKYLLWNKSFTGKNISIGIFDSGVNNKYLNCNIIDYINFTDEPDLDLNGHGTFISSVSNIYLIKYINIIINIL